jgi:hypothetical protein
MIELIEAAKANPLAAVFGFFALNAVIAIGRKCLGYVGKGARDDIETWIAGILRRSSERRSHNAERR